MQNAFPPAIRVRTTEISFKFLRTVMPGSRRDGGGLLAEGQEVRIDSRDYDIPEGRRDTLRLERSGAMLGRLGPGRPRPSGQVENSGEDDRKHHRGKPHGGGLW